jgi:hypothetical protein
MTEDQKETLSALQKLLEERNELQSRIEVLLEHLKIT